MTTRRSSDISLAALVVMLVMLILAACGNVPDDELRGAGRVGTVDGVVTDAESGRQLATERSCRSCHSIDGSTSVGPSWLGLAGSTDQLSDGATVVAGRTYLERSIREPQAEIVAGFDVVEMPTLNLSADEVGALVDYIESLG